MIFLNFKFLIIYGFNFIHVDPLFVPVDPLSRPAMREALPAPAPLGRLKRGVVNL
jgi:hypothetical protein